MPKNTLLVTGGLGFIGAHFVHHVFHRLNDTKIVVLDKNTYAADKSRMQEFINEERFFYEEGDIAEAPFVEAVFSKHQPTKIINFAAESHVDNSIAGPHVFLKTNVEGTFNLLEAARKTWLEKTQELKPNYQQALFYQVSTDEVFGSLSTEGRFSETSNYAPNSPYSASKAAADHWVRSYQHTYGLPVLISHCSNNYGPYQHGEKLIPTIVRTALSGDPIPIYGTGENIRDWLFVTDHCQAIFTLLTKAKRGESYTIGGNTERSNVSICKAITTMLDAKVPKSNGRSYTEQIRLVSDRPGHDFRYATDTTKIKKDFGWQPEEDFEKGLEKTVIHYLEQYKHLIDKQL